MIPVVLERCPGVAAFERTAAAFLVAREAEHNLPLGILDTLRTAPASFDGPPYLAVVRRGSEIVAAVVRTPPFHLVISEVDDDAAIAPLVEAALASDAPGLLGPVEAAAAVAAGWSARTGGRQRVLMTERTFRLTRVNPPSSVSGRLRVAGPSDRPPLVDWARAFTLEALPDDDVARVEATVDRWLAGEHRAPYLWDDGEPVSLCVAGSRTPNGVRIGPVYTPPSHRGRGYASACVAGVSQAQLDAGRSFCFLVTDLANPTSNRIYRAIGYEPIRDVLSIRLDPA